MSIKGWRSLRLYWKMDTVNNAISPICFRVNHAWYENKRLTSIAVLYRLRDVALFSFYLRRARGDLCVLLLFHLEQVNHLRCKNGISFFIMLEANIIPLFSRLAFLLSISSIKIILILFIIRDLQVLESFVFFSFHQTAETKLNFLLKEERIKNIIHLCILFFYRWINWHVNNSDFKY